MALDVGLVGAGTRARETLAPALAACPAVTFRGIWARGEHAGQDLAAAYGVTAYRSFDELVESCAAIAFAVAPPVQAEYGAVAARNGKAVLLQTPIAGDLAGAEQLALEVDRGRVVSQLALGWRYADAVREFLAHDVPRVHPIGGSGRAYSALRGATEARPSWHLQRGVVIDSGPELIDLLDAALGQVVGVRAHGDPFGWLGLLLEHLGGRFSEASMAAAPNLPTTVAQVEVFGPGGVASVDCSAVVGPDAYVTMLDEFASHVANGDEPELDVHRGLHLQRVIEAIESDLLAGV